MEPILDLGYLPLYEFIGFIFLFTLEIDRCRLSINSFLVKNSIFVNIYWCESNFFSSTFLRIRWNTPDGIPTIPDV
ncbi:hypothetical protein Avbf_18351 [Armadillidium vulgare]|nr:hypothetical protein Avbf_18351 [Armadillidium vulgare]